MTYSHKPILCDYDLHCPLAERSAGFFFIFAGTTRANQGEKAAMSKFKVGDRVRRVRTGIPSICPIGFETVVLGASPKGIAYETRCGGFMQNDPRVDCWEKVDGNDDSSPVRTVTRKEIVPGNYGCVSVRESLSGGMVSVYIPAQSVTPAELRAAATTFLELADALEATQ